MYCRTSLIVMLGAISSHAHALDNDRTLTLTDCFTNTVPLSNSELNALRGGVLLPNGLDVAIGIDIQTRVNGELALHTVLSTENTSPSGLRVFTDGTHPSSMPTGVAVPTSSAQEPLLILDRRGAGTTLLTTSSSAPATTVNVVNAPRETWPEYQDEIDLAIVPNGPAISTDLGKVTAERSASGTIVTLSSDTLLIRHLVGQATGVVVANTGNDRTIDTISAIDVDIKGAWPMVANATFSINAIAIDAATRN